MRDRQNYVHRIGRTDRAGALGIAISFSCEEGAFYLPEIEEYIGKKLKCVVPEEAVLAAPPPPRQKKQQDGARKRPPRRRWRPPQHKKEQRSGT